MLSFLFRQVFRFSLITLVTLVFVVALLSGLLRLGLPYASSYKNEIQAWVGDYLRAPVELGSMELGWNGFSPSLRLKEITLERAGDQRVEVKLEEILLDLNLYKSLFTGKLQINEVTLAGADLVLEYVGQQRFKISSYGLAGSADNKGKPGVADASLDVVSWLMNSDRVGLLESRVRLVDKKRGIDYQIDNLNVSAENTSTLHRLRLSMDLPEQLGEFLQIDLDLTGTSDAIYETSGNFYATATGMNLENWMRIWPGRTIEVSGQGHVEFWGEWADNELLTVRGRLDGSDVRVAENAPDTASHTDTPDAATEQLYSSVATDLFWQRGANGWRAEIDKLDFTHTINTSQIRKGLIAFSRDGEIAKYSVAGEGTALALATLGGLLGELRQTKALATAASYARSANIDGSLNDWKLAAEFETGEPLQVSLHGDIEKAGASAVGKIPGVRNLTGRVALDSNAGQFELSSSELEIELPTVFSNPLSVALAAGTLSIDLNRRGQLVGSENLTVKNPGLLLLSSFALGQDADKDWHIDLQSAAELDNVATAKAYLPDRVMPVGTTAWLNQALVGGQITSGSLILNGKLRDFPYTGKPGIFRAEVLAKDATLKFMPDWPAGTGLDGSAVFEGQGVSFEVLSGELADTTITRVAGGIANFRKPMLALSGANSGTLQSFVDFANTGPLQSILAPAFEESTATGDAVLNLELQVPLRSRKNRESNEVLSLDGTVFLSQNTLNFNRFDVALDNLVGAVGFSESGISIQNLGANYLASPVKITAQTTDDESGRIIELGAGGLLHTDKVLAHFDIPVHPFFTGPAKWDLLVGIPLGVEEGSEAGGAAGRDTVQSAVTLTARSDLYGTQVSLPEPLAKTTAAREPVVVHASFDAAGAQQWRIENNQARLLVKAEAEEGLQSLNVFLGQGRFKPDIRDGIFVNGQASTFAFDGWIEAVSRIIDELPADEAGESPSPILPIYANVGVRDMIVGSTRMGAARYRVSTDDQYINTVVNSTHLRGNIRIPRAHWDKDQAIKARVTYADSDLLDALADTDKSIKVAGTTGEPQPLDPTQFPRIEAHVSQFRFKNLTLRNLGLRAEPDIAGMKITALGFANENAQLIGEGFWHLTDPQRLNPDSAGLQQSNLSLNLQSNDIGRTLQQAGYPSVLAEGQGSTAINLSWPGPIYKPELATLAGSAKVYAKDGRILSIDPGAARLVGLIALQELPRRLSLDFRDLVKDGLDYKRISGTFNLGGGMAQAELLRLEGPIGVVEIQGQSDLLAQTFDQNIRVLPRVSAALPIIGILSGGASAGIGALLVSPVLKAFGIDIDRIGLTEYTLKGSWDKPEIVQIKGPAPPSQTGDSRD